MTDDEPKAAAEPPWGWGTDQQIVASIRNELALVEAALSRLAILNEMLEWRTKGKRR